MILHTYLVLALVFVNFYEVSSQNIGDFEIVAEWVKIEFDWESEEQKNQSISDGTYIPENNIVTGLRIYKGVIYVTVSRWLPGIPSTMNTLIFKDGKPVLKPFPNWDMQEIDNCDAFQFTQSMEIIPQTDEMWIIDVGRRHIWLDDPINNCPPKLRILDLNTNEILHTYTFPNEVLSYTGNFLNDIVVDPDRGFAYMSDVGVSAAGHDGGIVFYDRNQDVARRLEHPSMHWESNREDGLYDIFINGKPYELSVPVDGIGLTPDKNTVFHCPLGGVRLHQIQASSLRACNQHVCNLTEDQNRDMGDRVSETGGIIMGHHSLYYAAMGLNAIYRWDHQADYEDQGVSDYWEVNMTKQPEVKQDDANLVWSDSFALDEDGWLWTNANQLPLFLNGEIDFTGESGPNFRMVKVYVGDTSYLMPEDNASSRISLSVFLSSLCSILTIIVVSRH